MGGFLDLGEHDLLVVAYPGVMGNFLKFLEELVTILEVDLSELLPLGTLDLFISILPEPFLELCFEVLIGVVHLFPVSGSSYNSSTQFPPSFCIISKSRDAEDYFVGGGIGSVS